jgi:hypothetical protein
MLGEGLVVTIEGDLSQAKAEFSAKKSAAGKDDADDMDVDAEEDEEKGEDETLYSWLSCHRRPILNFTPGGRSCPPGVNFVPWV